MKNDKWIIIIKVFAEIDTCPVASSSDTVFATFLMGLTDSTKKGRHHLLHAQSTAQPHFQFVGVSQQPAVRYKNIV